VAAGFQSLWAWLWGWKASVEQETAVTGGCVFDAPFSQRIYDAPFSQRIYDAPFSQRIYDAQGCN